MLRNDIVTGRTTAPILPEEQTEQLKRILLQVYSDEELILRPLQDKQAS